MMVIRGHSVVIRWSFGGHSVVIQLLFSCYSVVIQLLFGGRSIVIRWSCGGLAMLSLLCSVQRLPSLKYLRSIQDFTLTVALSCLLRSKQGILTF
jgi:hypothetical protein